MTVYVVLGIFFYFIRPLFFNYDTIYFWTSKSPGKHRLLGGQLLEPFEDYTEDFFSQTYVRFCTPQVRKVERKPVFNNFLLTNMTVGTHIEYFKRKKNGNLITNGNPKSPQYFIVLSSSSGITISPCLWCSGS